MEVAVKNPESKLEVLREVRGAKLEVLPYCSRCVSTDIPGYLENGVHHHVSICYPVPSNYQRIYHLQVASIRVH